jgi:hypothetical protein
VSGAVVKQPTIFGDEIDPQAEGVLTPRRNSSRPPDFNPCVAFYGRGPKDKTCKTCVHLRASHNSEGRGNRHLKCDLRKITHGAATDHRAGWPACGRWEARP